MLSLSQIETDLIAAIKAKNQTAVDTLRGLKTRIQNEKISRMEELAESDLVALVKSEVKRRKEAVLSYEKGNRLELAEKESAEAGILEKYLPAQIPEEQIGLIVDGVISENNFTAADFGKAMGELKKRVGNSADGAVLARMLKEKLK